MKDRLWTKQYLLVIVTNFLLYVVYYPASRQKITQSPETK